ACGNYRGPCRGRACLGPFPELASAPFPSLPLPPTAPNAPVRPRRNQFVATCAIVFFTNLKYARMLVSRCSTGVSSSLQCDNPFDEYVNIITTGICGTISAASCSGPDGSRVASP